MSDVLLLHKHDSRFPARLHHFDEAPRKLYVRGRLDLLDQVTLGVVGSRDCSDYGREVTLSLVRTVAQAGAVIVSGMARGIDAIAHTVALDAGSSTIAVLGCGIDICYPKSNQRLYQRIADEGLLISEFEPGTPPYPYNFPYRNRVIAMLSRSLLVVEAAEKSGTRHTADVAMAHMDVLAVPGPIGRPTSVGTNRLLADGAKMVFSADEILDSLGLDRRSLAEIPSPKVSEIARQVWKTLEPDPIHIDEIAARASLPTDDVALALLELELNGSILQAPGARYARALLV